VADAALGRGLTKSVGSVYGEKDTSEPDTTDNCHLDFNHMPKLDMSIKDDAKGALDTKSVGSSNGGNDLFCERSAVGLMVELLSTVSR
jgi:hypothetical protein